MEQQLPARQHEEVLTFCKFINRMQERAAKEECMPVLNDLMSAIDYEAWLFDSHEPRQAESKWSNVSDFVAWINRKSTADEKTLLAMTQTIALMNLLESREEEVDAVSLSTLHAAKGLEYGHVFMVGVEEGVLPHQRSESPEQIEEERRLMYVGITRAQRSLQISYCNKRKQGKEWQSCEASRFIKEMPADDMIFAGAQASGSTPEVSKDEGMAKLARLKAMLG
jgi:ATP-dependent DNA helicase Rep